MLRSLVFLLLTISSVSAFNILRPPVVSDQSTRRDIIKKIGITIGITSILSPANADVIRGARCANGNGDGCDSLAEDNEFIQSLQKKSSENREKNERDSLNAYYMKNYPNVFAVSEKKMVKTSSGFALYSPQEVKELQNTGKISIEYPMIKGGRDLTQKPVLVLNE